jgi:3-hydroxyisobutyrate dehydrogenase
VKIGVVGIGRMGAAIAGRLLGFGHEVTVWNRTVAKAQSLVAAGAKVAATPMQLAESCEIILSVLTDAHAIDAAYRGPGGLLKAHVAGKLFVEMSTVRPATEQALAADVTVRGAALIDAPVGGTVEPAREGKLFAFVGGDASDVARARPILDQICRRVEHVGPVGAGASVKLAINLPLHVFWPALGEALTLCAPLDMDSKRLIDIIAVTGGAPNALRARATAIAAAIDGQNSAEVGFDIDAIRKDLATMIEEAQSLGARSPLAERALECYDVAAREGHGAQAAVSLPARALRDARSTKRST